MVLKDDFVDPNGPTLVDIPFATPLEPPEPPPRKFAFGVGVAMAGFFTAFGAFGALALGPRGSLTFDSSTRASQIDEPPVTPVPLVPAEPDESGSAWPPRDLAEIAVFAGGGEDAVVCVPVVVGPCSEVFDGADSPGRIPAASIRRKTSCMWHALRQAAESIAEFRGIRPGAPRAVPICPTKVMTASEQAAPTTSPDSPI